MKTTIYKCFEIIVVVIVICLLNSSCSSNYVASENLEITGFEDKLADNRQLCYADEDCMILTGGTRNGAATGSMIDTDYIIIYDPTDAAIKEELYISDKVHIYSVIPYRDGVVYSYSKLQDSKQDIWEWKIIYQNKDGKEILDEGICSVFALVPELILLKGKPVYLFENAVIEKGDVKTYSCGVKQISEMEPDKIMETSDMRLSGMTLACNGTEYGFLAKKGLNLYCYIGDLNGIKQNFEIDGQARSFTLTEGYAGVSAESKETDREDGAYLLQTFDLKKGKTENYKTEELLYGMAGGPGEHCLCVDWAFTPYDVDLESGELKELDLNEEYSTPPSIRFFPLNKTDYLVEYLFEENNITYDKVHMK